MTRRGEAWRGEARLDEAKRGEARAEPPIQNSVATLPLLPHTLVACAAALAGMGTRYLDTLLSESAHLRVPGACVVNHSDTLTNSPTMKLFGLRKQQKHEARSIQHTQHPSISEACYDGSFGLPRLVRQYNVHTLAEVGVCTGRTSVAVVAAMGAQVERYYLVDAWGARGCNPGCGCYEQLRGVAQVYPQLSLLRGYSVPKAAYIANASLDLAFVDAAHDADNVKADILAYWPKLRPRGVLAGHDFAHARNWAHSLVQASSRGKRESRLPPTYGVGYALSLLFPHCEVHLLYGVWWVEAAHCQTGPILQPGPPLEDLSA